MTDINKILEDSISLELKPEELLDARMATRTVMKSLNNSNFITMYEWNHLYPNDKKPYWQIFKIVKSVGVEYFVGGVGSDLIVFNSTGVEPLKAFEIIHRLLKAKVNTSYRSCLKAGVGIIEFNNGDVVKV